MGGVCGGEIVDVFTSGALPALQVAGCETFAILSPSVVFPTGVSPALGCVPATADGKIAPTLSIVEGALAGTNVLEQKMAAR